MADLDIPPTSLDPSPGGTPAFLSERISLATRSIHSRLNKLIITHLPLALPPYTTNPSIYVSGILHIASIYHTFEFLWQTLLETPRQSISSQESVDPDMKQHASSLPDSPFIDSKSSSKVFSLLSHLRLPGLLRAGRLKADIRTLTGIPDHQIDEQIAAVSSHGELARFVSHIHESVEAKPHVLIAYSWVLYMALFAGGRQLRASLKHAGGQSSDFWTRDPSPVRPFSVSFQSTTPEAPGTISPPNEVFTQRKSAISITPRRSSRSQSRPETSTNAFPIPGSCLQFFEFAGQDDGEDLKREFKYRMVQAEILLTSSEKEDIITEAQAIFNHLVTVLDDLNDICGSKDARVASYRNGDEVEDSEVSPAPEKNASRGRQGLPRDSLAIARERRLRKDKSRKLVLTEEHRTRGSRGRSYLENWITDPISKAISFNTKSLNGQELRLGIKGSESGKGSQKQAYAIAGFGITAVWGLLFWYFLRQ